MGKQNHRHKQRYNKTLKLSTGKKPFPQKDASRPQQRHDRRPQKPPQAAGPCAWACRRLHARPFHSERNAAPKPPTRGAWARLLRANGAGRRHCRPPCAWGGSASTSSQRRWPPALPARRRWLAALPARRRWLAALPAYSQKRSSSVLPSAWQIFRQRLMVGL